MHYLQLGPVSRDMKVGGIICWREHKSVNVFVCMWQSRVVPHVLCSACWDKFQPPE